MTIEQARQLLGDELSQKMSDKDIEDMVSMYRAISRLFINDLIKKRNTKTT
ncbi:MAG TPA: hypothetical protein PKD96_02420 [Candidatus Absconditabacterales bacterium]|nr:hypothetical protein [Candidatus Absconditabacterales bacterium]HMT27136.1 hypothetical protein [Candidatus Absconditabacterales bacterium]